MTNERESLVEKINVLNELIQELRKAKIDYSEETNELIRLILELDALGHPEE